jgi:hypothetical protein
MSVIIYVPYFVDSIFTVDLSKVYETINYLCNITKLNDDIQTLSRYICVSNSDQPTLLSTLLRLILLYKIQNNNKQWTTKEINQVVVGSRNKKAIIRKLHSTCYIINHEEIRLVAISPKFPLSYFWDVPHLIVKCPDLTGERLKRWIVDNKTISVSAKPKDRIVNMFTKDNRVVFEMHSGNVLSYSEILADPDLLELFLHMKISQSNPVKSAAKEFIDKCAILSP